jgi:hypothetical protein
VGSVGVGQMRDGLVGEDVDLDRLAAEVGQRKE